MSNPNRFWVEADVYTYDPPMEKVFDTHGEAEAWMNKTITTFPKAVFTVIYGHLIDVRPVEVATRIEMDQ